MYFDNDECKRYARNFALPEIGVRGQRKLKEAWVLVIGAGGLGSTAVMYLAAAGVGVITIVDYDYVEESNFNRQVIHTQVGVNKAKSAEYFVNNLNPHVSVLGVDEKVTPQNILGHIDGFNFIVDCTSGFDSKFLINDACVLYKKPYCHGGATGTQGEIMTYVPGSPCLRCLMREIPFDAPSNEEVGILGPVSGMIGCMQAMEAIKYITGAGELLTGRLVKYDALETRFQTIRFGRDKDCPACGDKPSIKLSIDRYRPKK